MPLSFGVISFKHIPFSVFLILVNGDLIFQLLRPKNLVSSSTSWVYFSLVSHVQFVTSNLKIYQGSVILYCLHCYHPDQNHHPLSLVIAIISSLSLFPIWVSHGQHLNLEKQVSALTKTLLFYFFVYLMLGLVTFETFMCYTYFPT